MWTLDKYEQRYLEFLADGAIFSNNPMMRGVVGNFNGPQFIHVGCNNFNLPVL
jgi:hypothetical protein